MDDDRLGEHARRAARTYGAAADHHLRASLGSGYRGTVDALSQEQRDRVRDRVLGDLRSGGITSLRTDVIFGTARRPDPEAGS